MPVPLNNINEESEVYTGRLPADQQVEVRLSEILDWNGFSDRPTLQEVMNIFTDGGGLTV